MRYVVARDGIVENVIVWNGEAIWSPPEGTTVHAFPEGAVSPGWEWNAGAPVDPATPPEE